MELSLFDCNHLLDLLKVEQQGNAVWMENAHVVRALRLLMQYGGWIVPRFAPKDGSNPGGLLLVQHPGVNNQFVLKVFPDMANYEVFADACTPHMKNNVCVPSRVESGRDLVDRVRVRNAHKTARPVQWLLFGANLGTVFGMGATGYGLEMMDEAAVAAWLCKTANEAHPVNDSHAAYWEIVERNKTPSLEAYCCRATAMQYAGPDETVAMIERERLKAGRVRFIC